MARRNKQPRLADMSAMVRVMASSNLQDQALDEKRALLARMCKVIGEQVGASNGKRLKHNDLPPRVAQTLQCLLSGQSEKEVARELGLSPHTIHVYVKTLHKHFNVSSRAELLARFV